MRILIDINHPAHVHLFKNFAWQMQQKGHEILFTTRQKEISDVLLKNLGFDYICFGKHYKSLKAKLWGILKFDWMLLKVALRFKPDLFLSMTSIYASHVALVLRKVNILLTDTENATFQHWLGVPFCDKILTPVCFKKQFRSKQLRYEGYHELAYLHPNYFQPDARILDKLGVRANEKFVLMRFVSWNAHHDIGHRGLTPDNKIKAVEAFSKYARVFISSEDELPAALKSYQIKIPPEKIHHALAYASLLYGESATMASECAVLGTPAIYLDNVGRGYTDEQEAKYQLVFNYTEALNDQERSIQKGIEILQMPALKTEWQRRRERLLAEKIDVTAFLVWFVENFPDSLKMMENNPSCQYQFK